MRERDQSKAAMSNAQINRYSLIPELQKAYNIPHNGEMGEYCARKVKCLANVVIRMERRKKVKARTGRTARAAAQEKKRCREPVETKMPEPDLPVC
jgi:hypothetical protein